MIHHAIAILLHLVYHQLLNKGGGGGGRGGGCSHFSQHALCQFTDKWFVLLIKGGLRGVPNAAIPSEKLANTS